LIANWKHIRKKDLSTRIRWRYIIGQENLKNYIMEFYRRLFGAPTSNSFSLVETENEDIPQFK
jgi:hypothetical protein